MISSPLLGRCRNGDKRVNRIVRRNDVVFFVTTQYTTMEQALLSVFLRNAYGLH
jgi:hypothetical protein